MLYHTVGNAHEITLLSALEVMNDNWLGCQRACIILSVCSANWTQGNGWDKSPKYFDGQ